jgi:hypothetical protein
MPDQRWPWGAFAAREWELLGGVCALTLVRAPSLLASPPRRFGRSEEELPLVDEREIRGRRREMNREGRESDGEPGRRFRKVRMASTFCKAVLGWIAICAFNF